MWNQDILQLDVQVVHPCGSIWLANIIASVDTPPPPPTPSKQGRSGVEVEVRTPPTSTFFLLKYSWKYFTWFSLAVERGFQWTKVFINMNFEWKSCAGFKFYWYIQSQFNQHEYLLIWQPNIKVVHPYGLVRQHQCNAIHHIYVIKFKCWLRICISPTKLHYIKSVSMDPPIEATKKSGFEKYVQIYMGQWWIDLQATLY